MTGAAPRHASYPAIDILRGFAALSVVVYHVIEHCKWAAFPASGLIVWFRIGWMGVDLFLVISGLVIALSIESMLARMSCTSFLVAFARRRFLRIAPLYYTTCVIYVVCVVPQLLPHPELWQHALSHLAFVHNMSTEYHGSIDGPNWSVALEMQFYVLFALTAPLLFRLRWWQLLLGAIAISWSWRYAVTTLVPFDQPLSVFQRFVTTTQLPGTLDEFAVGILLASVLRAPACAGLVAWCARWPLAPAIASAAATWLLLKVFWAHAAFWDSTAMIVFWRSGCGITFALVVFTACCLRQPWFLQVTAPLRYLGTISFGIYLWHLPVLLSVQRVEWLQPDQVLWVVVPCTLLLASGSWHLLERPTMRQA